MSASFSYGRLTELAAEFQRPTRIVRNTPSQLIMIGSTQGDVDAGWAYVGTYMGTTVFPHPGKTTNLAFADGHVKNVGNKDNMQRMVNSKAITFDIQR